MRSSLWTPLTLSPDLVSPSPFPKTGAAFLSAPALPSARYSIRGRLSWKACVGSFPLRVGPFFWYALLLIGSNGVGCLRKTTPYLVIRISGSTMGIRYDLNRYRHQDKPSRLTLKPGRMNCWHHIINRCLPMTRLRNCRTSIRSSVRSLFIAFGLLVNLWGFWPKPRHRLSPVPTPLSTPRHASESAIDGATSP